MTTLIVGDSKTTWRQWLKEQSRDVLCLDPTDADHGPPCRAFHLRDGKVHEWRLIGSIDPLRNPLGMIGAAWHLLRLAREDLIVQLFAPGESPLLRQMALMIAQSIRPDEVLVPAGSALNTMGWPVGAEEIELPAAFPPLVFESQRRARWLELIESAETHDVDLSQVSVEGSWLRNGTAVTLPGWIGWAERTGSVLHLVGNTEVTDEQAGHYLDHAHASRLTVTNPTEYKGLLCSFSSQEGEDFGQGVIQEFNPERMVMRILCNAVAPAPVRILRLGTLRIDSSGKESGHIDRRHL